MASESFCAPQMKSIVGCLASGRALGCATVVHHRHRPNSLQSYLLTSAGIWLFMWILEMQLEELFIWLFMWILKMQKTLSKGTFQEPTNLLVYNISLLSKFEYREIIWLGEKLPIHQERTFNVFSTLPMAYLLPNIARVAPGL